MAAFWEMMGVDVDAGPTTEQIKAAFRRCEEWSRDDRMRLGYLAIFIGFIEGRNYSTATRASLARLVMDLERFENYPWGRVVFKVLIESLKGKDLESNSYTVDGFIQVLQVWVYFALPEFGANYGHPLPNRTSPLLMAYNGGKGRRFCKEAISRHTSVINFVQKDFAEMFPRWDFDEVTGTKPSVKKEVSAAETDSGVKEENARPQKKARKEASIEASKEVLKEASVEASKVPSAEASTSVGGMTKEYIEKSLRDIADVMRDGFGMCLKEIKLLGDWIEVVEKKVGITKKGTASNELQLTTSNPEKGGHEPGCAWIIAYSESLNEAKAGHNDPQEPSSSKDRSLVITNEYKGVPTEGKPTEQSGEPSVLVLDKGVPTDSDLHKEETRRQRKRNAAMGNNTAKVIIPNKRVGQGYDPFAPVDKKMSKMLTDWVKLDPYFKTPRDKKPRRCPSRFYHILRTPLECLSDGRRHIRRLFRKSSDKSSLEDITEDLLDDLSLSHKYREFKSDEDDINGLGRRLPGGAWNYHAGIVPLFCQSMKVWGLDVDDIYVPVNFRNEHWIAIWISIPKKHIVVWDIIISHIRAVELDELMEPFVTMCRAGDYGVFALKYIECHALGISFPPEFCTKNAKAIREKMALDILKETPEGHPKVNEDNDETLRTYDEQG
ncbi:hypothetical protein DY000_02040801 [Brassica cretica]|uniref:Ubiquitin-like protease family profile domain-containing protein n=1 Tax=Brassica cretica TaxID=69181 RepID=A0ABQ7B6Q7_BRACR|nr:hypothetical protein DY000_02040801 [Brassica cretica]